MAQVVDKRDVERRNLQVEKSTEDPDWSLNQDWNSTDWDLSPKN
jgi:hypothetical protein